MSVKLELLLQATAEVGEGPIFLGDSLLWVDIPVGKIHETNLETLQTETITLDTRVGAVAPLKRVKILQSLVKKALQFSPMEN